MKELSEDDTLLRIDAYIKGHLSEKETADWARQIDANPVLAAQVESQRRHLMALELMLEHDFRAKMSDWDKEMLENEPKTRFPRWAMWAIGLIGLLVATLIFYFFQRLTKAVIVPPKTENINPIVDTIKEVIPNLEIQKPKSEIKIPKSEIQKPIKPIDIVENNSNDILASSRQDLAVIVLDLENNANRTELQTDTLLKETYRLLREKNYFQAIKTAKNAPNTEGVFALGIAYFMSEQYNEALPIFEKSSKNEGFIRAEAAEYYAALCLLGTKQNAEAKRKLFKIADDKGHPLSEKAKLALKMVEY